MEVIGEACTQPVPMNGCDGTLRADRLTLARRRWRGTASDGREFGFDLSVPLVHGATFASASGQRYLIEQNPEPVLEITLIPRPAPIARLGWALGNLHFPIEVTDELIRVPDETALRQFLEREKIPFAATERVFQPFARAHAHAG
jgi:urease accessory protein